MEDVKLPVGKFAKLVGFNFQMIQRMDNSGLFKAKRTPTNRRYYLESDVERFKALFNGS